MNQAIQNLFSNVLQKSLWRRTELASQQQNIDFVSRPLKNCYTKEGHNFTSNKNTRASERTNVECVYLDIFLKNRVGLASAHLSEHHLELVSLGLRLLNPSRAGLQIVGGGFVDGRRVVRAAAGAGVADDGVAVLKK